MLAIVLTNASFLKLTARPPPRAMSAALWLANMPQGAEFAAFAHPPGIVYCWELPVHHRGLGLEFGFGGWGWS